jgi:exopolysaccharide biosynthesis protein
MGFLANIFLTQDQIEEIMGGTESDEEFYDMDVSLITLPAPRPIHPLDGRQAEALPETDNGVENLEDDDGLELHQIVGNGYLGYMLIVHDPTRLFVGTPGNLGGRGMRLTDMVENTGAVAGINGGGFYDPGGTGAGGVPDGLVIQDGRLTWGAGMGHVNVIGFDADGILHVGTMTPEAAMSLNMHWAVSFGPTLISNGVAQDVHQSGLNPRTAIGQRADGAVLMLVVEGRQIDSLGATLDDLIEIFLSFDAINASNLDGGSSTMMILEGESINRSASVVGPRYLPTSFLVRN